MNKFYFEKYFRGYPAGWLPFKVGPPAGVSPKKLNRGRLYLDSL